MTALERALTRHHSLTAGDPEAFAHGFHRALFDTRNGRDTEAEWLRIRHLPARPAEEAGYLEGLASLREPAAPPQGRRPAR
ncbi:hypothetical protein JE024_20080 [Streptomyces zhihengii]|uniref:Uncharacterized protein n=1 Tax=Streptomyces zhihengii TaxID=1818004 RepID=A0ABS2UU77_9ACTN|nr:hypothetical protein [Streptomyces zhihengii]MBM9620995.1 hypothetical protein [Streptomyces zhihengii]